MHNLFTRRSGGGVAPWVPFAAIVGVLALIFSLLTLMPATASADEDEDYLQLLQDQDKIVSQLEDLEEPTTSPEVTTTSPEATTPAEEESPSIEGETLQESAGIVISPFAVNEGITVDVTKIVSPPPGGQLQIGDKAEVSGTWDATDADPQPGDTFTVGFPAELKIPGGQSFPLAGPDGQSFGTCLVAADNTFTCTLSEAVIGKTDVSGTWFIEATASEYTTSTDVEFTVPGATVKVPLPGENGGISDGTELTFGKTGKIGDDNSSIRWTVDIPGNMLTPLDPNKSGKVTLNDVLPVGTQLCETNQEKPVLSVGRTSMETITEGLSLVAGTGQNVDVTLDTKGAGFKDDQTYRVEYTICSEDGEMLKADNYTNTFTVGDQSTSGTVGVAEWKPRETPTKSGSIFGNLDKIAWEVQVPSLVVGDSSTIKFTDTLTGDHEFCGAAPTIEESLQVPVWNSGTGSYDFQYSDVTDQWTMSPDDLWTGTSVEATFTTDAANVKANHIYKIRYTTCLTTKGDDGTAQLPDRGQQFTNEVTVNGESVDKTVKADNPTAGKTGVLNKTPVTVGGVEQPAGTSMNWKIKLPGYDLENLTQKLTGTDILSANQQVCGGGTATKDNLNLKVYAQTYPGATAVDTDFLTDSSVSSTGQTLNFEIAKPDGHYSRAYTYYLEYTTCTESGGQDAQGTIYANDAKFAGVEVSSKVTMDWNAGGTGDGVDRGSFSLTKVMAEAPSDFPNDAEFTVKVEEFAPEADLATATPDKTYDIKVKAGGPSVSGQFSRGDGWTIRLTETGFPNMEDIEWGPGVFVPGGGVTVDEQGRAIVTITPGVNVKVNLENKATSTKTGSVQLKKVVVDNTGGLIDADQEFNVTAKIPGAEDVDFTLKANETKAIDDLPIGTVVTFTETAPADTDLVTWAAPVFEPASVTVGKDTSGSLVTLTNTANGTTGNLTLAKKLSGPEQNNSEVPDTFAVNATWDDGTAEGGSAILELKKDGTPVSLPHDLPGGTKVTLSEVQLVDGNGLAWGTPVFSGTGVSTVDGKTIVTIGKDVHLVTLTNFVDKNTGTLRLTKLVSGEAAEAVGDDVEFTVKATWKDNTEYKSEALTVKQGETTELSEKLPVGTEVTFSEITRPDVASVNWGSISWDTTGGWLKVNPDGTATGIVSDNPEEGRLVSLTNEALWKPGAVSFEKRIADGEETISVKEAVEKKLLPDTVSFDVKIKAINLPSGKTLPEDAGIAVGDIVTLNKDNDWTWTSKKVLPKGTTVVFDEVTPTSLPGVDWGKPLFESDTLTVDADKVARATIKNTIIPTTPVDVAKKVTGPKGTEVANDPSTSFQVTATWTVQGQDKSCVLDVVPGKSAVPTENCEATVIDGKVYFPRDTEITFAETGQTTDVPNVKWQEVIWTIAQGQADITVNPSSDDTKAPTATITIKGDKDVVIGLENKTSSNGLIIIPIPIPIPTFPGGSSTPTTPVTPGHPGQPIPATPDKVVSDKVASDKGTTASGSKGLAQTGANVIWIAGGALILIAGGAWFALRGRKKDA